MQSSCNSATISEYLKIFDVAKRIAGGEKCTRRQRRRSTEFGSTVFDVFGHLAEYDQSMSFMIARPLQCRRWARAVNSSCQNRKAASRGCRRCHKKRRARLVRPNADCDRNYASKIQRTRRDLFPAIYKKVANVQALNTPVIFCQYPRE